MATLQTWRKAYGALKDHTTVGLAQINSDYKDLDVAIVKATNHVEVPPKDRHLRKILIATSAVRPRADVAYCIHALARRLGKTRNWTVALKTLIVIHRLLREGDPTFREELLNFSQRGLIPRLSNFKDDSSPIAWDCSAWVRTYALFLEERLECFRLLKYDIETERLSKPSEGPDTGYSRTRNLDSEQLLDQLPLLQQLLYRLVGCRPEGAAVGNYVIQYALALVLKESFKVYCAINDGIINLVDKFFEMPRHEAIKALEVYRRAGQQAGSLSDFYEVCKGLELALGLYKSRFVNKSRFAFVLFEIVLILGPYNFAVVDAKSVEHQQIWQGKDMEREHVDSHSCIHDLIIEQRKRPGRQVYSVTPQVYKEFDNGSKEPGRSGRRLLGISDYAEHPEDAKQPIRIYLNYDAVGHSPDRDCRNVGDIVKLGEPSLTALPGKPACNPHCNPPILGDCWYNCTLDDISSKDKRHRLRKALGQTTDWFRRALAVEPVKGNLRLSGYSACGQDGGVQLPREYVEEGVGNADLVLLVTTRPTTGNTLAWAVACERDQWGRAIAGHVNVAPRHLTAEAETLLSATLIHEVMHVLGFDPHAFAHFRDERKRRRAQVSHQAMDERLGRMVTRVVLPRVIMQSRNHFGAFSDNFTGLELEDGGGRGTSGSHWEKRLLMNEIMTGSVDTRSVVSTMTLALLEDSGWYKANYSMAERLDWGRNQGTDFVTSPCNQWKGAYTCNNSQLSGCTYNREAEGYCPIVSYSGDLPQWARYFPQANKGGQSSLADYCAYFVAYSDGSCTNANSARAPDKMLGELRGSSSRCMSSSLVRTGFVRGSMTQGNGCYEHRCVNNTLEVAVDGRWKVCPEAGGPVQFPGFNGDLVCPAYHELCTTTTTLRVPGQCPNSCSFNGDCMNGKCYCFLGFNGHDCSKRSCPSNCSGRGKCLGNGLCECENGFTGIDCSTAVCDEQCSLHGGVCENGICEFRCSDYAGYKCQNSSKLLSSLSVCKDVLQSDLSGQHCAPSEPSILQQLEIVVVRPNYNRLFPGGARKLFNIFGSSHCDAAAKRLACWISIQKCDKDGDDRLRVCHSACHSYNLACGASLDCSDQTLFSSKDEGKGHCTGEGEIMVPWFNWFRTRIPQPISK